MTESRHAALVVAVIGTVAALLSAPGVVRANHQPSNAVVTPSTNADAAATGGNLEYTISGKNDGPQRSCPTPPAGCSDRPTLEAVIPAGATFVTGTCRTTPAQNPVVPCTVSGATVTAQFTTVAAHATVKMILTVKAPTVSTETTIVLSAKFSGESMHMDQKSLSTPVLPLTTTLKMLPSGNTVQVACGDTVTAAAFGADTEAVMQSGMVCNNGSGLTFTASGKTLNLAGKTIFSSRRVRGNAAIIVGPDSPNVTINGGGTGGTKGIEQFEYCVKDLGGNTFLHVTSLRCFRAKGVGILTLSNNVVIDNSLVDRATPDASIEVPGGGIGIQAGGDNIRVKDTIVRRSAKIGFWANGVDADGSGVVATYDGNTTTSRIENSVGIAALLSGGPHKIKGTQVEGDGFEAGTSLEGIVVAENAVGTILEEVVVKKHRGHGIWVKAGATGTVIERTNVEEIGGSGYVIDSASTLNGNSAKTVLGDGFVINTNATLTSNSVEECSGNAFVINGAAFVDSNSAVDNGGYGFVVTNASPGVVTTDWSVQGVGDFDGNGRADILWRHTSGAAAIWLMNATGTGILSSRGYGVGADWTIKKVGDFNGDDKADILWRDTSGNLALWLMNGTDINNNSFLGNVPNAWSPVGLGDFNGVGHPDRKADIFWRDTSGHLALWRMNGATIVSNSYVGNVPAPWAPAGFGDFNGDGNADILWRDTSGNVALWLMNGASILSNTFIGNVGTTWLPIGFGDFDGDGNTDIVWRDTSGNVAMWLMNGTTILLNSFLGNMPTAWTPVGVGDFNGDGNADILWRHTSGELTTWLMNGTTLITAAGGARLRTNTAEGNASGGFRVSGSGNFLQSNNAKASGGQGSGGKGFDITGGGNVLNTNKAERSDGPEFVIGASNIDDGNNSANGNRFSFPAAGGTFE